MSDRIFGILFSIFLGILAFISWLLSGMVPVKLIACAGCFFITALVQPNILLPLNRIWQWFGLKLGPVINTLVLGLFYFLVVLPIGISMKLVGSDPMNRKSKMDGASYWSPVDRKANAETYIDTF
jgi:hypothetical protein